MRSRRRFMSTPLQLASRIDAAWASRHSSCDRPPGESKQVRSGSGVIMWVRAIDHVQIAAPAGCEAEARRFFGGLLELEEVRKPAPLAERGGCWFKVGSMQLHVGVERDF